MSVARMSSVSAAERVTVDSRDGRLVANLDLAEDAMHNLGELTEMGQAVARVEIGNIAARDKCPIPCAGNNDDPNFVVSLDAAENCFQLKQRGHVQRIEHFGAIDRYDRDMICSGFDNALIHARSPYHPTL